MMCCEPIDIGCFKNCKPIVTGFVAPLTGDYVIHYQMGSGNYSYVLSFNAGDSIAMPYDIFNDDTLVKFQIELPDGSILNNSCYVFRISNYHFLNN